MIALQEKLKKKREEMRMVEKDMTVLSMLIDGTLPDDMKQQGILLLSVYLFVC